MVTCTCKKKNIILGRNDGARLMWKMKMNDDGKKGKIYKRTI